MFSYKFIYNINIALINKNHPLVKFNCIIDILKTLKNPYIKLYNLKISTLTRLQKKDGIEKIKVSSESVKYRPVVVRFSKISIIPIRKAVGSIFWNRSIIMSGATCENESRVQVLIKRLKSRKESTRKMAVYDLAKLETSHTEDLVKALGEAEQEDLQIEIIRALGKLKGEGALEALIERLQNGNKKIRKHATVALGVLKNPNALNPLCQALKDSDLNVRKEAVWSLFLLKDQAATKPLCKLLKNRDKCLRIRVIKVIGELGDLKAIPALLDSLNNDKDIQKEIIEALAKLGALVTPEALQSFKSNSCKELKKNIAKLIKSNDNGISLAS